MSFPRVLTADEAAALIPDEAIVTVSSSSGLGCPDAVLAAIGRRFENSGHPTALRAAGHLEDDYRQRDSSLQHS